MVTEKNKSRRLALIRRIEKYQEPMMAGKRQSDDNVEHADGSEPNLGQKEAEREKTSRRLGHIELAPTVRTDWALHNLAGRRRLELDAGRTLLPVLWLVLVFSDLVRDLRLGENAVRHRARRDDGASNHRYAL
jgi:hypothetical protein